MDEYEDIDNVGNELLKKVQDQSIEKKVQDSEVMDPFYALKLDVYDFFRSSMKTITRKEELLRKVDERIDDYVENNEMDFDQLMQLRRAYSGDSLQSREGILGLFRPVPGTQNLLIDNISKKDESVDAFEQMYEKMSASDLEKLDKMIRVMKTIDSKEEDK